MPIKTKFLFHFIFWVKILQKGAGEIQAKDNFKNFPSELLIFRWVNKISSNWITFQQPDKAYNTKKIEKKARTPENIISVRDSVGRLRSPCSFVPLEQRWSPAAYFINCFRTVEM